MKYYFSILIIISVNCSVIPQSNKLKTILNSNLLEHQKIEKIDSLINANSHNDSLFFINYHYAKWLYKNKQIKKAILINTNALNIIKTTNDSINIQKTLFWLGYYYKNINSKKSKYYFTKSLKVNNSNNTAINAYYYLGNNIIKSNDFIEANKYYLSVIKLSENQNKKNRLLRGSYYQISNNYFSIKSKKSLLNGIKYAKKADSISNIIPTSKEHIYLFKLLLASLYNDDLTLDIGKSLGYYNDAKTIAQSLNDTKKIDKVNLLIGALYNTTNFKKSLEYLNLVEPKKKDSSLISEKAFYTALTYYYKGDFNLSIQHYQKSLKYHIGKEFTTDNTENYLAINNLNDKFRVLHILPFYARTYFKQYQKTKNTSSLDKSIFYYKLSDQLVDLIKENSISFKSRLFWREKSEKIYSKAIESCYASKSINDALFFMEKNKALLLSEDIAKQNFKLTLNIDKTLLEKEITYKKELNLVNQKMNLNQDSLFLKKLQLERKLNFFQDSIYKGKFKKNIDLKITSVIEIQKSLEDNEVFVEYHISSNKDYGIFSHNKKSYAIFLTKKQSLFIELNKSNTINNKIIDYLKLIKKPFKTNKNRRDFEMKSNNIYHLLFPTRQTKELIFNKKLIIAPDGIISFLPFETLITNNTNYLIQNTEISYVYSMSFLNETKKTIRKPTKEVIAFSPINFNYDSLNSLPNSKYEIEQIKNSFNTKLLIDNNATKQQFTTLSNPYNIVHIASHADATNTKMPWIAFKKKKLYLDELYTTKTQADLVVLSACNTSLGDVATGEGVLSLARGFFYAGANTVVSSLWNVNDKATTEIMNDFYKNLKTGKTKSKALHKAKINYLNKHDLSENSPYYWASFVLIGDSGELYQINNNTYYYLFVSLLLLLTILIIFKLRNKHFS